MNVTTQTRSDSRARSLSICAGCALLALSMGQRVSHAETVGLELRPVMQTVAPGDPVDIEVYFTGDQYYVNSDVSLDFDSSIVDFGGWTAESSTVAFGATNVMPMVQSAPFTSNLADTGSGLLLSTASFTATGPGTTTVSVLPDDLLLFADPAVTGFGVEYSCTLSGACDGLTLSSAIITVVPLPPALFLLLGGLASLGLLQRARG